MLTNGHKDMGVRLMVGIWGVRMIDLMMRIELPGLAQLYTGHTKACVAVLKGNEYV